MATKNSIEVLLKRQIETNADYVCGNFMVVQLLKHRQCLLHKKMAFDKTDSAAFDCFFTSHLMAYTPWGKLYKKQILEAKNVSFNNDMTRGEDALFNYQYLQYCKCIATTEEIVYYYNRINLDSATKRYISNRNISEYTFLTERRKLYSDALTETQQYKEDDLLLFVIFDLCKDFTFFLHRELAVEKIKETLRIFAPLLEKVGEYDRTVQSEPIMAYIICRNFIETSDYEELYAYLFSRENHGNRKSNFPLVRKILMCLRELQLFTLKLGYR